MDRGRPPPRSWPGRSSRTTPKRRAGRRRGSGRHLRRSLRRKLARPHHPPAGLWGRPPSLRRSPTPQRLPAPSPFPPDYFELHRAQRADLDALLLTALAKTTRRRYGSARELREDIERYLDSRPLVARGDGQLYRIGKWIRRHRAASVAIVTSALLVASLLGFGLVAIGQAEVLEAERNRAQAEARKAAEVADFLGQMFASADPQNHQGAEPTARALLALGKARIDGLEAPDVRLELLRILVRAYSNLGDYAEAADLGKRRVDGARRTGDPTILGNALVELADAERLAGRVEVAARLLAEAEPLFQNANPGGLAFYYDALGDVERDRGQWPEAAETFRRSRDLWIDAGDPHSAVVSNRALGVMLQFLGKLDEAEDAQRWGLRVLEELGEPDPLETLSARQALAMVISAQGRHGEAEGLLRDAVEGFRSIYGGDHPNVAAVMTNLATVLANDGRGADAEGVLLDALDMRRRLFPEDHPEIANSFHNLGSVILTTRPEEAEAYLRRALELRRTLLGSDHVAVAITLGNLADSLWLQERLRESLPMRREALRILEAQLPPESPDLAYAKKALARTLERLESPEDSRKPP
ncbi:MAG: tetratricopeptide repeat protein [Acidobacteriota bacterium]